MKAFKNILFPVDLSDTNEKIVPYVQVMADKFDATIHLLFVARVFDYFAGMYVPSVSITSMQQSVIEGSEIKLSEFEEQHFSNHPATQASVLPGDASEVIIKYIESNNIDLIIMGTHGRKGLDKVLFGSVAERVVKTAPVPVMVINPYKTE
jgi:nucleotide-binding universal stress UspA family protein